MPSRKPSFGTRVKSKWNSFLAVTEHEPWIFIRRVVWFLVSGWILCLYTLVAAFGMLCSIVFFPFAVPAARLAYFSLFPLLKEPRKIVHDETTWFWDNPHNPYTFAANIFWAVFFGWHIALVNLVLAVIQFLSIVGIGNVAVHFRLAKVALWPFGKTFVKRPPRDSQSTLPTSNARVAEEGAHFHSHGDGSNAATATNSPHQAQLYEFEGAGKPKRTLTSDY